jgi:hypothetical protein
LSDLLDRPDSLVATIFEAVEALFEFSASLLFRLPGEGL